MAGQLLAARLRRLPVTAVCGHMVPIAVGPRARLHGLAGLERERAGAGLLIPRCRSVHTFGMRFPLDLVFLDAGGRAISVRREMPPRRLAFERRAAAVLELPAGTLGIGFDAKSASAAPPGGEFLSRTP